MKRTSVIACRPAPSILFSHAREECPSIHPSGTIQPPIIVIQKSQGRNIAMVLNSIKSVRDTFHSNLRIHPLYPLRYTPTCNTVSQQTELLFQSQWKKNDVSRRFTRVWNSISFFLPHHRILLVPRVIKLIIFRLPFVPFPFPIFPRYFQSCTVSINGISSLDTFKRQYHCPSAWYVNLLRGCLLIRFSTTSFTVHDPLSWQRRQRPTFLMHDSRRKSAEKGLVSPISGTDWVIRIYRRNTRFLPADCRRYRIRFDKLHSLFPFPFFPFLSSRRKETALPPFSRSPIVRLFDLLRDTRQRNLCCFDKQYTEISADKVEPFQRGEMMIIVFARNTGRNIIFRLLSPNRYKLHLHYLG